MTTVYLIRHAEAEGNLYRRVQGSFDGKITPRGAQQIKALGAAFEGVRLDAVYSSDRSRAMQTASVLLPSRGLELVTDPRLRECACGVWEDIGWGDVEHAQPDMLYNFNFDPARWSIDGGENYYDLIKRMTGAVKDIAARHPDGAIAIVSHGMAIRALLCSCLGIPSERVREIPHSDNTAIARLAVDGDRIEVLSYGDNSHLSESISTFARQDWWKRSGGTDRKSLRYEPIDLRKEAELYRRCYGDAWLAAHGSTDGFAAGYYLHSAREHAREHPQAVKKVFCAEDFAGLLELSVHRDESAGAGWITLCYLTGEFRDRGLGVQLLGEAMSFYRRLGRSSVRLHVAEDNARAVHFYQKYGFLRIGDCNGAGGKLFLLERPIL